MGTTDRTHETVGAACGARYAVDPAAGGSYRCRRGGIALPPRDLGGRAHEALSTQRLLSRRRDQAFARGAGENHARREWRTPGADHGRGVGVRWRTASGQHGYRGPGPEWGNT